jgi:hypothetical protein
VVAAGTAFPYGVTAVTCTAADAAGNVSPAVAFAVSVVCASGFSVQTPGGNCVGERVGRAQDVLRSAPSPWMPRLSRAHVRLSTGPRPFLQTTTSAPSAAAQCAPPTRIASTTPAACRARLSASARTGSMTPATPPAGSRPARFVRVSSPGVGATGAEALHVRCGNARSFDGHSLPRTQPPCCQTSTSAPVAATHAATTPSATTPPATTAAPATPATAGSSTPDCTPSASTRARPRSRSPTATGPRLAGRPLGRARAPSTPLHIQRSPWWTTTRRPLIFARRSSTVVAQWPWAHPRSSPLAPPRCRAWPQTPSTMRARRRRLL